MAAHLTPDEMKIFVRKHFEDFVNEEKVAVIRTNMTADFVDHDGPGGKAAGVAEDEQMMRGMYEMLPGVHITIDDMVAEGDKVICRNVWRWTDVKTGKHMAFRGFVEWRFEDDKIAERWATVTPAYEDVTRS